jgi:hypothetical protein
MTERFDGMIHASAASGYFQCRKESFACLKQAPFDERTSGTIRRIWCLQLRHLRIAMLHCGSRLCMQYGSSRVIVVGFSKRHQGATWRSALEETFCDTRSGVYRKRDGPEVQHGREIARLMLPQDDQAFITECRWHKNTIIETSNFSTQ